MRFSNKWLGKLLAGHHHRSARAAHSGSLLSDPFEAQARLIHAVNSPDITIFDIGAHKGQTTNRYRTLFPVAEIYSFEASPDSVSVLTERFSKDQKIHIVPVAVGQKRGEAVFYVNQYDATNSLLPRPSTERRYYPSTAGPKESITVKTECLDDFARENNISRIDILKFDIQGGELNALQGAKSLLGTGAISLVYTEILFVHLYEAAPLFNQLWSFLSGYGYSLFDIYNLQRATNGQLKYGDAIFVSDHIRKNIIDKYPEEP